MDTINVEANAQDLAKRIAREAARAAQACTAQALVGSPALPTHDTPIAGRELEPRPLQKTKILSLLQNAREKTTVSRSVPKVLRRLFRKQGSYNDLLLETVATLLKIVENLHGRTAALAAYFQVQGRWLEGLSQSQQKLARSQGNDRARLSAALSEMHELRNRVTRMEAQTNTAVAEMRRSHVTEIAELKAELMKRIPGTSAVSLTESQRADAAG